MSKDVSPDDRVASGLLTRKEYVDQQASLYGGMTWEEFLAEWLHDLAILSAINNDTARTLLNKQP